MTATRLNKSQELTRFETLNRLEKPNKHQVRSRATQLALLDAAEKVFLRDGFELAQIDVIAAEAGRTRGAVYTHFESKADLFLSVMRRRMAMESTGSNLAKRRRIAILARRSSPSAQAARTGRA